MKDKLEALATLLADYREGDIPDITPEHVDRWVSQFDKEVRGPMLDELHHVWSQLYFGRKRAQLFLRGLITNEKFVGADMTGYWTKAVPLNIQTKGQSQHEMLALFGHELQAATGLSPASAGNGTEYVYIDDVLFTGSRVQTDLKAWLQKAPARARVRIVVLAYHGFGEYKTKEALQAEVKRLGKDIAFEFWRAFVIENRVYYSKDADVLWPACLPPEAAAYDQGKFPLKPRVPGGASKLFSSEARRDCLEQEFVKAGLKIRSFSASPKPILRPLGFSPFGVGFGSLFLSWRNCPNNAPLALWWGGKTNPPSHPFNKWYPLVPRKTYAADGDF